MGGLSREGRGGRYDKNESLIDFSARGERIPEDFIGLSFDMKGVLSEEILLPENRSLISLVQGLGSKGIIRIGGNSSDRPSLRKRLTSHRPQIENLGNFLSATGWQQIYGLDLCSCKAEPAATGADK